MKLSRVLEILEGLHCEHEGASIRSRYRAKTMQGESISQLYDDEAAYHRERAEALRVAIAGLTVEPSEE